MIMIRMRIRKCKTSSAASPTLVQQKRQAKARCSAKVTSADVNAKLISVNTAAESNVTPQVDRYLCCN